MNDIEWHARFSQQAGWTAPLRRYLLGQANLPAGARLLEVGCGTGAVLAALAEEALSPAPSAARPALYGLDIQANFLRQAARNAPFTRLTQGDAYHLPYAADSFDLVICHYLLLWLDKPGAALAEMRRVARPGGWVCALAEPDYAGRVDYPEALAALGQAQRQALRQQGADPESGRKLAGLLAEAGLRPVETGVLGGQWRGAPSPDQQAGEWAVLAHDLAGTFPADRLARLHRLDEAAWQANQRTLFVPTFYALSLK